MRNTMTPGRWVWAMGFLVGAATANPQAAAVIGGEVVAGTPGALSEAEPLVVRNGFGPSTAAPLPSPVIATAGPASIVAWGSNSNGQCNVPSPNAGFVRVAAGEYHSLGLKHDGSVVARGYNNWGQCNVPSPNTGFIAVAAGGYHSLGLKEDGSIVAWGANDYGQCNVPEPNTGFVAVAAGEFISLALRADGSVAAWGDNWYGHCNVPEPNAGFVAIASGASNDLALTAGGAIVAWGNNGLGQCNLPAANANFVAVAGGAWHGLGLKDDGSIVVWGNNEYGQRNVPSPNTGFVAIAAGGFHSLGLKGSGSIAAWGYNNAGQCNVPENAGYEAVSAGLFHSLAIKQDLPPYPAGNPFPADGAIDVLRTVTLSWTGGDPLPTDRVLYDVYFGTADPPPQVASRQAETTYRPASPLCETQYYWRIVSWDGLNQSTAGPLWTFVTTAANAPPNAPENVYPPDGARHVPVDISVSWTGGDPDSDAVTYDVYFGTGVPPAMVSADQTAATYATGPLQVDTTYAWQIVARDRCGATTSGPLWTFTTRDVAGSIVLYVGGTDPDDYPTIQAGVDAAVAGDTVYVHDDSAPYYERVVIDKSITLMGENRDTTIIDGGGGGVAVYIRDVAGATVAGFTMQHAEVGVRVSTPCEEEGCGWSGFASGTRVANNRVVCDAGDNGIEVYGVDYDGENNVVTGNEVSADAGYVGLWLESGAHDDAGYPAANNVIDENTIQGSWEVAVVMTGHSYNNCDHNHPHACGDQNRILNNIIISDDYGIWGGGLGYYWKGTFGNTIEGNVLVGCYVGMFFGYPADKSTGDNRIADNTILSPTRWLDIYIRSDHNDIGGNRLSRMESEFSFGNKLHDNTFDGLVVFYEGDRNHFIGNTFTGGQLWLGGESGDKVYHNDFLDSSVAGSGVAWDNGYPSGGNYWSDYGGSDGFHGSGQNEPGADGIGDSPHGGDRYPFVAQGGWVLNYAPYPPYNPVPSDGYATAGVSVDLAWTGGDPNPSDEVLYDVYFGAGDPPSLVSTQQAAKTYDPGMLAVDATYYWRVVAWDDHGASSSGPLWEFRTQAPLGDLDLDGDLDYDDYVLFRAAFGHSAGDPGYNPLADLDGDGSVTLVDYRLWREAYGRYKGDPDAPLPTRAGDMNLDGLVNFEDVNPFVQCLTDFAGWQAAYAGCPVGNGDINGDGSVNLGDINPLVALLSGH